MDETVQREMESKMGGEFNDVRIHTGPEAATAADSISARAFTVGNHVAFNRGEYHPETEEGKRVLTHELTHVRQQTGGRISLLPKADPAQHDRASAIGPKVDIQPKLEVSSPDDPAEQEAEKVAEQVVEDIPRDQQSEDDEAQRDLSDIVTPSESPGKSGGGTVSKETESTVRSSVQAGGKPLPSKIRSKFETKMGADFSDVTVHTGKKADAAAKSINAEAFTIGSDIAFAKGNYNPSSMSGRKLLAHELTHVAQQNGVISRQAGTDSEVTSINFEAGSDISADKPPELPEEPLTAEINDWDPQSKFNFINHESNDTWIEILAEMDGEVNTTSELNNWLDIVRQSIQSVKKEAIKIEKIIRKLENIEATNDKYKLSETKKGELEDFLNSGSDLADEAQEAFTEIGTKQWQLMQSLQNYKKDQRKINTKIKKFHKALANRERVEAEQEKKDLEKEKSKIEKEKKELEKWLKLGKDLAMQGATEGTMGVLTEAIDFAGDEMVEAGVDQFYEEELSGVEKKIEKAENKIRRNKKIVAHKAVSQAKTEYTNAVKNAIGYLDPQMGPAPVPKAKQNVQNEVEIFKDKMEQAGFSDIVKAMQTRKKARKLSTQGLNALPAYTTSITELYENSVRTYELYRPIWNHVSRQGSIRKRYDAEKAESYLRIAAEIGNNGKMLEKAMQLAKSEARVVEREEGIRGYLSDTGPAAKYLEVFHEMDDTIANKL
jgi:uncharacterized protein YacL (UPF0231 family)